MNPNSNFGMAIHGGAGDITPANLPPDQERECRDVLQQVLQVGHAMLAQNASALDAVEAAVRLLEDSPLFNAGRGASFTHDGRNELDASIMDGRTLMAGGIAGVTTIRNPVSAARAVMERSPYVLLIGAGAEAFAANQNLEIVEPSYFATPHQREKLEELQRETVAVQSADHLPDGEKFGTVGAVALDKAGHLAAATSTGGMINRKWGRVGDSPLVGAGTYANDATCAVSSTGHGEHFICNVVAYDISALMEYRGLSLRQAAAEVVLKKLRQRGGDGGIIAIDKAGNLELCFNSAGMYRGQVGADGQINVAIFG